MKIVFIGSGNVATHLAKVLKPAGHQVLQVYSKTFSNAKKLADEVKSEFTNDLKKLRKDGEVYVICVKDDAVKEIVHSTEFNVNSSAIIVHTSGTLSMDVFKKKSQRQKYFGVFYPLQTFSRKRTISFQEIPVCIEAGNKSTKEKLTRLARSLSKKIYFLNSEQRKTAHLAAVFACNFTNRMYVVAHEILRNKNIPFEIIEPLILETANKTIGTSPLQMQTGPAKRGDKKIIQAHLQMLNSSPEYKKIYRLISKNIADANQ